MKRLITIILAFIMTLFTAPQKGADQPPVTTEKPPQTAIMTTVEQVPEESETTAETAFVGEVAEAETTTEAPKKEAPVVQEKVTEECTEITPFQRRVYMELLNVPAGATITYGELARRIGCRSAQAVGQALKRNPFAPEVPCHRVVAAGGSIGGYFGKRDGEMIERKRKLIEEEQESANNRIQTQKSKYDRTSSATIGVRAIHE